MHITERVLMRAKELVAEGFVVERDCHSAENARGKLVRYTDAHAKRFFPSAAIWRAEWDLLDRGRRGSKPIGGHALILLVQSGYSVRRYTSAESIEEITELFDIALAQSKTVPTKNVPWRVNVGVEQEEAEESQDSEIAS